jgi:pimeloyl-ACP methyl ester carboxylesterase
MCPKPIPREFEVRLQEHTARFYVDGVHLDADVSLNTEMTGVVLFVHGSGSGRHSPRNQFVAAKLRASALGTVLLDLLTPNEEHADQFSGHLRFNIPFLARRVSAAIDHLRQQTRLPLGMFGASTGAAAALVVAANRPAEVGAIVSRGGRPDLAGNALAAVKPPTLLIVGGADQEVLELNTKAMDRMTAPVRLEVVPGATHLFHEPGALETVAELAADWFRKWLVDRPSSIVHRRRNPDETT